MTDQTTLALLIEALTFLNDAPRFALRQDRTRSSYALATRIDEHLRYIGKSRAPADVVTATRSGWRADRRIRIDDLPAMRLDRDGMWVGGWVLAGSGDPALDAVSPERLHLALAAIPLMAREVFRLHRDDELDYATIGRRLGISTVEVQRHLVDALVRIDTALGG